MSQQLPEPPASLTGDRLEHWLQQRDDLVARGPVRLTFPDESLGLLTIIGLGADAPREADAAGTIELATFETARAQLTSVTPQLIASLPRGALVALSAPGMDDACLAAAAGLDLQSITAADGSFTVDGLRHLEGCDSLRQLHITAPTLGDAAVDALVKLPVAMLGIAAPAMTGPALSRLLSTSSARVVRPRGVTPGQLRSMTPLERPDPIELSLVVSDEVTTDDVVAMIESLGAGISSIRVMSTESLEIDLPTHLRLQYRFPDLNIQGRWHARKAIEKLAAKAGIDLNDPFARTGAGGDVPTDRSDS